jgi:hypothetical protein
MLGYVYIQFRGVVFEVLSFFKTIFHLFNIHMFFRMIECIQLYTYDSQDG